jgi:metal iron transporter
VLLFSRQKSKFAVVVTMNCPSRTDPEIEVHPDWNQNPHDLSSDLTTRADLNGIVNLREERATGSNMDDNNAEAIRVVPVDSPEPPTATAKSPSSVKVDPQTHAAIQRPGPPRFHGIGSPRALMEKARVTLRKYAKFVGPGFLIAVAYIDPGNYATDVEAGASTRYRHLFIILLSNLFAIFLQSLCIKLGSVTGLNLAENCRKHLPKWLNLILYLFAESAIIATDIAEVSVSLLGSSTQALTSQRSSVLPSLSTSSSTSHSLRVAPSPWWMS